ncbi:MAG: hypothetical protein HY906_01985 [Deltaproteobacteria bacterium]|nr:hypothetical protein [Deltaproteobacteria bacterium]
MGMCESIEREARNSPFTRDRAGRILAKTIYRELRLNGFDHKQIVSIAGNLISQVTEDIRPVRSADEIDDVTEASLQAAAR